MNLPMSWKYLELLDKSNCRKCNEKTCLAFASKVFLGQRHLEDCPALPRDMIEKYREKEKKYKVRMNTKKRFWQKKKPKSGVWI